MSQWSCVSFVTQNSDENYLAVCGYYTYLQSFEMPQIMTFSSSFRDYVLGLQSAPRMWLLNYTAPFLPVNQSNCSHSSKASRGKLSDSIEIAPVSISHQPSCRSPAHPLVPLFFFYPHSPNSVSNPLSFLIYPERSDSYEQLIHLWKGGGVSFLFLN